MTTAERRELAEIPPISRGDLYEMIRRAGKPETYEYFEGYKSYAQRNQRLLASFFLFANRVSEGLNVGPEDVTLEVGVNVLDEELRLLTDRLGRLRTEIEVGAALGRDMGDRKGELGELFEEFQEMNGIRRLWNIPSEVVRAADMMVKKYPQTKVYVVKLRTLKRKKKPIRNIPVPVVDPLAPLFVEQIPEMGRRLFKISRQRVWQIFTRVGLYNFYKDRGYPVPKSPLRHARLSEVSGVLNPIQLARFAGWKIRGQVGTADHYIHSRWEDFLPSLIQIARRAPPLAEGM